MKNSLLLIIIFMMNMNAFSQGSRVVMIEANLKEKHNQILRGLPKVLVEAFCAGDIPGYYPEYIKAQVSFTEFLNYAGLADPSFNNEDGLKCPYEFCKFTQNEMLPFQFKIQILEREVTAGVGQEPSHEIHFVKLKIYHNGKYFNGPVFLYNDIISLGDRYTLFNPKNDAAPFTIKKVLLSRMFSAHVIKDYTNIRGVNYDFQKQNTDDDIYEY